MKNKKKVLVIVTALVMCILLSSCSLWYTDRGKDL